MMTNEPSELSERELEILRLVATGASNKEIAQQLFISTNTVKVHLRNIFAKIGAASRTEAAMHAVRIGLVQGAPDKIPTEEPILEPGNALETEEQTSSPISTQEHNHPTHKRTPGWAVFILIIGIFFLLAGVSIALARGSFGLIPPTITPTWPSPTSTAIPRWKELAALPTARSGIALAALENQIYAIGGITIQGVTGVVERYDLQTDTWTALSPMPVPVTDVSAVVIGGLIYVPGGRSSPDNTQISNHLEIYDPKLDRWSSGASLPVPISGYALVAFEGRLFLFGGWDGHNYLNNVYMYDPFNDSWQERASMPTARAFSGAAEASEVIYVIGGFNGEQPLNTIEIYSPGRENDPTSAWESTSPLPQGRYSMGVTSVADLIYLTGGIGDPLQQLQPLEYSPVTHQWQYFPMPLPESWNGLGMLSLGPNLYMLGGQIQGLYTDLHLSYQAIYTVVIPIVR
jgi:DNA-binding CsgD family transcriptional regulator/N-acetylneuraminic acid mutarotase